jgi:hypothetical protein
MLTLSEIKMLFKDQPVEINMRKISVNGSFRGVSGFIKNTNTNLIVYVNTELGTMQRMLYRCARDFKDYQGGSNRFAKNSDDLFTGVIELLTKKRIHLGEFGADFGQKPKLVIPAYQRQVAGSAAFF